MAIFKPGPAIGTISGNAGGASFVQSKSGPVMRSARSAGRTSTKRQNAAQTNLRNQINRWNALTDLQRAAWRNAATLVQFPN